MQCAAVAPALSPKTVMQSGLPPKQAQLFLIHFIASTWSLRPALPGTLHSGVLSDKKPGVEKNYMTNLYIIS